MSSLDNLRKELAAIDDELLQLVARRRKLVHEVGRQKEATGRALRDFDQERRVFERARARAEELGLSTSLSDALMRLLIGDALTAQEKQRISQSGAGSGKSVLVIGGGGRMGRWFAQFLVSQEYRVVVADPANKVEGLECHDDWRDLPLDYDVIVVATPLRAAAAVLKHLAAEKPRGLVFDIGSLKGPLHESLQKLVAAGVKVASIHPMFGPDTDLLSGRHVIVVDVGDASAARDAAALFASTMVEIVPMSLEDHDRLIATILGLSHATNIAFFSALSESGEPASRLARMSSTTFEQQLAVAEKVSSENPSLYFEIQNLNPYGVEILERLQGVVTSLTETVRHGDEAAFAELMKTGNEYLRSVRARSR